MKLLRSQWDRVAAAALAVLGLVVLLLGYLGASSSAYAAEQLPYMISGGVLGIFLLGAAAALYLSADLRDEWRKLNSIDVSLKEIVGWTTQDAEVPPAAAVEAVGAVGAVEEPVTAPLKALVAHGRPGSRRAGLRAESGR